MGKNVTRLYTSFQPKHYQLDLAPNRDTDTFAGTVTITGVKVGRPSQRITLHQNGLKITSATITRHDKRGMIEIAPTRVNHLHKRTEVRLHADTMLYPGNYTITLTFSGAITRNMEGMYPCFFTHQGVEKKLIATQFESHHARDVFPCIDEPEAKATFKLSLTTPAHETVLSNTPIEHQQADPSDSTLVHTTFETTPKMSTYLLAFVYGELAVRSDTTSNGTIVNVYATPDNEAHTAFALESAIKTLEFYNDYFAIPYPLPKCDFIALPDFASGAMENWGCITFREQALLVDPQNTSADMKQYVANVIAHELTHQWFGNLVTMRWWTDLWLNEGFASWMSYLAIDHLYPEWNVWPQFIADDQAIAFRADALEHTHPIEVPIHHPDEIRTIFDSISYDKGASVIHMLHQYLGAEAFRDGIRHYLQLHAYGNTDSIDLWDALESTTHKDVRSFMHDWITQSGFPVVHATVTTDTIRVSQQRFYLNPQARTEATTWPIPLQANHTTDTEIFNTQSATVGYTPTDGPLVLNHERSALYHVVYDSKHLQTLGTAIDAGKVSVLDRFGLLADAMNAARAGVQPTTDALALLTHYRNEDNTIVWDIISGLIGSVRAVMDDDELRELLKPYTRTLIAKQFARLGWEPTVGESHYDTLLRPTIIAMSAGADDPDTVKHLRQLFDAQNPEAIHPDIRGIVYSSVAYHGDAQTFDALLALHNASTSSEERIKLTAALCHFRQPELIARALACIISPDVRLQDVSYWIAYSFGNRFAKQATWQWVKDNWQWLEENTGKDLSFYRMPIYVARAFSDREFLREFTAFFNNALSPAFERPVKQGIETIEWQSAWRERDAAAIKTFFATQDQA